jgi:hypothetical protein
MSKIASEMLTDIEKETVDFADNFDETRKEPLVLPSRFPNLLVNGSMGIAVGMATNIPPHNLSEVIDAVVTLIDDPEADLEDIMTHVKGPDFPTGGIIMGRSGIREAYYKGRGKVTVRAKTEMEEYKDGRARIVVTQLPYMVNKARLRRNFRFKGRVLRPGGHAGRHRAKERRKSPGGVKPAVQKLPDAGEYFHHLTCPGQQPSRHFEPAGDFGPLYPLPGGDRHPAHPVRPKKGERAGPYSGGLKNRGRQYRRGHSHHPQ